MISNKNIAKFLGLITAFVISGCASTYSNVKPNAEKVDLNGMGVIVGSAQESSKAHLSSYVSFYYRNKKTKKIGVIKTGGHFLIKPDNVFIDNKRTRGVVFASALPPGNYEFYDWTIRVDGGFYKARSPRIASFTVELNKVIYLGNLHMLLLTDKEMLWGENHVSGGIPIIKDQKERDIPLLQSKYSFLKDKKIDVGVIKYNSPTNNISRNNTENKIDTSKLSIVKENHAEIVINNVNYVLDTYIVPFQRPYYIKVSTTDKAPIEKSTAEEVASDYIKPRGCTTPLSRRPDLDQGTASKTGWLIGIEC